MIRTRVCALTVGASTQTCAPPLTYTCRHLPVSFAAPRHVFAGGVIMGACGTLARVGNGLPTRVRADGRVGCRDPSRHQGDASSGPIGRRRARRARRGEAARRAPSPAAAPAAVLCSPSFVAARAEAAMPSLWSYSRLHSRPPQRDSRPPASLQTSLTRSRRAWRRTRAPWRSWRWSACPPTSATAVRARLPTHARESARRRSGARRVRGRAPTARRRRSRHPPAPPTPAPAPSPLARRRRGAHVGPVHDPGHQEDGNPTGHGQGAHRPLCRGAGAAGARGGLHRRVGGAHHRGCVRCSAVQRCRAYADARGQ
jgi:hypothetical protein